MRIGDAAIAIVVLGISSAFTVEISALQLKSFPANNLRVETKYSGRTSYGVAHLIGNI
jgi:hypothetical protein